MADVAQTALPQPSANTEDGIVFSGTPRNLATGLALIIGGGLSFTMGMTNVFFASAVAWVFVAWGLLFLYNALIEMYQTYKVTHEALIVDTPWRPVERHKVFDWAHLHRVDIFVKRNEPKPEDIVLQVYHTPAGEIVLDREDRRFDPQLAQLILDRAKLKSTDASVSNDMSQLPKVKGHYIWNQTGKAPVAG